MNYVEILGAVGLLAGAFGLWMSARSSNPDRPLFYLYTGWVLSYLAPAFLGWTAFYGVAHGDIRSKKLLIWLGVILACQMTFTFWMAVRRHKALRKIFADIRARGTHTVYL